MSRKRDIPCFFAAHQAGGSAKAKLTLCPQTYLRLFQFRVCRTRETLFSPRDAFALRRVPLNYPLFFLPDLFILCLLAPIFGALMRRSPLPGVILISLVFLVDIDQGLVMRSEMPVSFCLGGYVAICKFDVRALDKYSVPCLLLFLTLCATIIIFKVENTTALRLIAPVLVWPAASLLIGTRFGR
jgi:succinoglycan biosynthesis protein ExoH